jgi:hypothetical protein
VYFAKVALKSASKLEEVEGVIDIGHGMMVNTLDVLRSGSDFEGGMEKVKRAECSVLFYHGHVIPPPARAVVCDSSCDKRVLSRSCTVATLASYFHQLRCKTVHMASFLRQFTTSASAAKSPL